MLGVGERVPTERTYHSVLIDALTVGVAVLGLEAVHSTFGLVDLTQPSRVIIRAAIPALALGTVFMLLFHFLFDDWHAARRIDVLCPYRPTPSGLRFYLDISIAALFAGSFYLAESADSRLTITMGLTYALGAIWAALLIARGPQREARGLCSRYVVTHTVGAYLFFGLFLQLRSGTTSRYVLADSDLWRVVRYYLGLEALDFAIRKTVTRAHIKTTLDWLVRRLLGLSDLFSWLGESAKSLQERLFPPDQGLG